MSLISSQPASFKKPEPSQEILFPLSPASHFLGDKGSLGVGEICYQFTRHLPQYIPTSSLGKKFHGILTEVFTGQFYTHPSVSKGNGATGSNVSQQHAKTKQQ